MPDPLFLYVGIPVGVVALLAGTFLLVKHQKDKNHAELAARINEELNVAAEVDHGVEKEMQAPTAEEKVQAEREMWEDETN